MKSKGAREEERAQVFSLLALANLYPPAGHLLPPDDTRPIRSRPSLWLAALTKKTFA
jgi:hypothetical protein